MPWTASQFRSRHNHRLSDSQADEASRVANALLRKYGDDGKAIRIANSVVQKAEGGQVNDELSLLRAVQEHNKPIEETREPDHPALRYLDPGFAAGGSTDFKGIVDGYAGGGRVLDELPGALEWLTAKLHPKQVLAIPRARQENFRRYLDEPQMEDALHQIGHNFDDTPLPRWMGSGAEALNRRLRSGHTIEPDFQSMQGSLNELLERYPGVKHQMALFRGLHVNPEMELGPMLEDPGFQSWSTNPLTVMKQFTGAGDNPAMSRILARTINPGDPAIPLKATSRPSTGNEMEVMLPPQSYRLADDPSLVKWNRIKNSFVGPDVDDFVHRGTLYQVEPKTPGYAPGGMVKALLALLRPTTEAAPSKLEELRAAYGKAHQNWLTSAHAGNVDTGPLSNYLKIAGEHISDGPAANYLTNARAALDRSNTALRSSNNPMMIDRARTKFGQQALGQLYDAHDYMNSAHASIDPESHVAFPYPARFAGGGIVKRILESLHPQAVEAAAPETVNTGRRAILGGILGLGAGAGALSMMGDKLAPKIEQAAPMIGPIKRGTYKHVDNISDFVDFEKRTASASKLIDAHEPAQKYLNGVEDVLYSPAHKWMAPELQPLIDKARDHLADHVTSKYDTPFWDAYGTIHDIHDVMMQ